MTKVPDGWIEAPIGSLCVLRNGRAFGPSEWTTEGLPIVRIQNLKDPNATFNYYEGEVDEVHRLHGGELLFSWSGTPGTSFGAFIWEGGEAVLNQHIFRVDFDESLLDKRFFRYAMNERLNELIEAAHGGVGLRHITKGVFEATRIKLAPLAEQRRIASIATDLQSRADRCLEHLKRIPNHLDKFRSAVLHAATTGMLDLNAEIPIDAWEHVTIGDLLIEKPRNGYSPRAVDYKTPVKSLTLRATTTGKFLPENFKYVDTEIPRSSHLWLQPGDILVQRANSLEYVGVSAIYDGPPYGFIYPDLMMKCRANERVLTKYLHYSLLSPAVRKFFRENATGTAGNMPKINNQTLTRAPVLLPPLEYQHEIVDRVEGLFSQADALEERYRWAVRWVERFPSAVMEKAFAGALGTQDPADEPAALLLNRILAWRDRATSVQKPRKPRQKERITTVRTLLETLRDAEGWISADEAFRRCGLTDGAETDRVEQLYGELRDLAQAGRLETSTERDTEGRKLYDRIRLIGEDEHATG
ncbi:MAG TPA: restriction endonuclease subunit S [Longimicrobium sp.]